MAPAGAWRLIREEARSGPMNMALDEVAARTAASGGPRTVRVYSWAPSTLSMGYAQSPETVDWSFCEREGVDVTRRETGGGGIYHDRYGDISYAIVLPADEVPGDLMTAYHQLLRPVLDAFDRMEVPARIAEAARPSLYQPACYLREIHPAHDVVVDGRKISGNAQRRTREAVIQHGSITYARESARHLGVFVDPGVTSDEFERRVTSIREHAEMGRDEAVATLEDTLAAWVDADEGSWTQEELSVARTVAEERFSTVDRRPQG